MTPTIATFAPLDHEPTPHCGVLRAQDPSTEVRVALTTEQALSLGAQMIDAARVHISRSAARSARSGAGIGEEAAKSALSGAILSRGCQYVVAAPDGAVSAVSGACSEPAEGERPR